MAALFSDSHEAAFRKLVRTAIRRSGLTRGQRDVTLALVDLWFHHRNGPLGYIYPGRAKLAKKSGVTEKTVSRTLALLRDAGVLIVVGCKHGEGQKSTRYKVRIITLLTACGCDIPGWFSGELTPQNVPPLFQKCPTTGGTKCPTVLSNVLTFPSQEGKKRHA